MLFFCKLLGLLSVSCWRLLFLWSNPEALTARSDTVDTMLNIIWDATLNQDWNAKLNKVRSVAHTHRSHSRSSLTHSSKAAQFAFPLFPLKRSSWVGWRAHRLLIAFDFIMDSETTKERQRHDLLFHGRRKILILFRRSVGRSGQVVEARWDLLPPCERKDGFSIPQSIRWSRGPLSFFGRKKSDHEKNKLKKSPFPSLLKRVNRFVSNRFLHQAMFSHLSSYGLFERK